MKTDKRVGRLQPSISLISSIEEEPAEGVVVALVIAEETPDGQVDRHLVARAQVHGHDHGGAVLLILHVLLPQLRHALAVDVQGGAGGQRVAGGAGVAVGGEGQAVGAGSGGGEDARLLAVAAPQVHEDVAVGDQPGVTEGAEALQIVLVVQGHGEGAAAGWGGGKEGQKGAPSLRGGPGKVSHL